MEIGDHDDYVVKVDGSGRLSKRTRTHLRPIQTFDNAEAPRMPEPLAGQEAAAPPPEPEVPATPSAAPTPRRRIDLPAPLTEPQLQDAPPVVPALTAAAPPAAPPAPTPAPILDTPPAPRRSERLRKAPERLIQSCALH